LPILISVRDHLTVLPGPKFIPYGSGVNVTETSSVWHMEVNPSID
jgi:hypothetical protein